MFTCDFRALEGSPQLHLPTNGAPRQPEIIHLLWLEQQSWLQVRTGRQHLPVNSRSNITEIQIFFSFFFPSYTVKNLILDSFYYSPTDTGSITSVQM